MTDFRKSIGTYFHLIEIFTTLNTRYFDTSIQANIVWGRRNNNKSQRKRSIRLGSYHPHKKNIIIHPCLDQAIVPLICVERIIFHEMTHQKFPPKKGPGNKNLFHYKEFYEFEKTYPFIKEADSWLKVNLMRLLSY